MAIVVCCIYSKPHSVDGTDSECSSDDDDKDKNAYERQPKCKVVLCLIVNISAHSSLRGVDKGKNGKEKQHDCSSHHHHHHHEGAPEQAPSA
jgi:hypothetical protein